MEHPKNSQIETQIAEAQDALARGEISRREFNKILFFISIASGVSLFKIEQANAWLATRMRKRTASAQASVFPANGLRMSKASSSVLTRTPSVGGNQAMWTFSTWVKRNVTGGGGDLLGVYNSSTDAGNLEFRFISTDQLNLVFFNFSAITTTQVFRDTSAWYHVVLTFDSGNANAKMRARLFVNGAEITSFSTDARSSISGSYIVNAAGVQHNIGRWYSGGSNGYYLNDVLSETYLIDGQALTPSSFGQLNLTTGSWDPKQYAGTFGTNGFYLPYKNNSAASGSGTATGTYPNVSGVSGLGADFSGNNNHWAASGIATTDQIADSPANNFATLNSLDMNSVSLSRGGLSFSSGAAGDFATRGTMAIAQKTYFEFTLTNAPPAAIAPIIGVSRGSDAFLPNATNQHTTNSNQWSIDPYDGQKYNGGASSHGSAFGAGDVGMIAVDPTTGKIWFGKNGTWFASGAPASGTSPAFSNLSTTAPLFPYVYDGNSAGSPSSVLFNFGQGGLSGLTSDSASGGIFKYTPPAGFKALSTSNLPTPAIQKPSQSMNVLAYVGNGGVQRVGDLVPTTTPYTVTRSLRFNSPDSPYLTRSNASAGNRKTWTVSLWVKRMKFDAIQTLFDGGIPSGWPDYLNFDANNKLYLHMSNASANGTGAAFTTTRTFKNSSSWMHVVVAWDTTQAVSTDRLKLYVDGAQITAFDSYQAPSLNYDSYAWNNTGYTQNIGRYANGGNNYFDGYMTEISLIDGLALEPTAFGQTDSVSGDWVPIAYMGAFGTNGAKLNFSDNSNATAATLGKDSSGGGNNWAPNNFSVAAGTGNDSFTDSPSCGGGDSDGTGANSSANYCTLDALRPLGYGYGVLRQGGLEYAKAGVNYYNMFFGTQSVRSGKWYWEVQFLNADLLIGVMKEIGLTQVGQATTPNATASGFALASWDGQIYNNSTATAYASAFSVNDIIGVALDLDNKTLSFSKNGTSLGVAYRFLTSDRYLPFLSDAGGNMTSAFINFGQRPFSYAPPTGHKCINSKNVSASDAADQTAPDLVWIKSRSAGTDHAIYDSARGVGFDLASNSASIQTAQPNGVTRFTKTGFVVGPLAKVNTAGASYVSWMWKKGVTPGFDVVTGIYGQGPLNHSLGAAPAFMIIKEINPNSNDWYVYHQSLGASNYVLLDTTGASTATSVQGFTYVANTTQAGISNVGLTGRTGVMYLFAEVPGFSKMSGFTGNGSADGAFVWCGFRPKWVMIRRYETAGHWETFDSVRNPGNNVNGLLETENASAENTASDELDFLSNGFKIRTTRTDMNASGGSYLFVAFAEAPFKTARAR